MAAETFPRRTGATLAAAPMAVWSAPRKPVLLRDVEPSRSRWHRAAQVTAHPVSSVVVEVAVPVGAAVVVIQALVVRSVASVKRAAPFVGLTRRAIAVVAAIGVYSAIAGRRAIIGSYAVRRLAALANRAVRASRVRKASVVAADITRDWACLDAAAIVAQRAVHAVGVSAAFAVRKRRAVRCFEAGRARVRTTACGRAVFVRHATKVVVRATAGAEYHRRWTIDLPLGVHAAQRRQRAGQRSVSGTA